MGKKNFDCTKINKKRVDNTKFKLDHPGSNVIRKTMIRHDLYTCMSLQYLYCTAQLVLGEVEKKWDKRQENIS